MSKETSKKAATAAAKTLRDKSASKDARAAAASALSQAGDFDNAHFTLLADHVREFLSDSGVNISMKWYAILDADLKRIDEGK